MPGGVRLDWDVSTRRLIERDALYGRMSRLRRDGSVLCCYEKGGLSWVRRSRDGGRTFLPPSSAPAARYAHGSAANPELLELGDGRVLLFFNERPRRGAGLPAARARFGINASVSRDGGATWAPLLDGGGAIFRAGHEFQNGCWEPAALELPSGEVWLFFANEAPFPSSHEQEISLCRSTDGGATWTAPRRVIFRAGHRDGMPVPLLLSDGQVAVAIEDDGLGPGRPFQPAVVTGRARDWLEAPPADGRSPRRAAAVTGPPPLLPREAYAGAPYLRQLPTGETLLSCQSTEGRPGDGDPLRRARMAVYVGDARARGFGARSFPFGSDPDAPPGLWNSLFVRDASAVTALSSTGVGGVHGLWAIDARVVRG